MMKGLREMQSQAQHDFCQKIWVNNFDEDSGEEL